VLEAVSYVLEAVEALAEAHAAGFVHRDLKPANLFVARRADRSRHVKVLDFGISGSMADSQAADMSLTKTGVIIGSPLYMSPEQMRSTKHADQRSDVWALGAILFQLVTGRPPYMGETIPELCAQLFSEDAPPPSRVRGDLPPGLDLVVGRALARDPALRYQNVAELGEALVEFAPGARVHAERARRVLTQGTGDHHSEYPPPRQGDAPTIDASVATVQPASTTERRTSSRGRILVGVAAVAALGFVVFLFQSQRREAVAAGESEVAPPAKAAAEPTVDPPDAPARVPSAALPDEPAEVSASASTPSASGPPAAQSPPEASVPPAAPVRRPPTAPRRPPSPPAKQPSAASGITDFGGRR
jgi:serine/threonine-protein kinase